MIQFYVQMSIVQNPGDLLYIGDEMLPSTVNHYKDDTVMNQPVPIESMYGIFTYIYHKHQPNVGKYTMDCMGYSGDFGVCVVCSETEWIVE